MKKSIICDNKISELNKLCYPEDRPPFKSIRNVTDLSFRNAITPEKYIKERQKARNYNEVAHTYYNIEGETSSEYVDLFKKLERKLLSIGGYEVKFSYDCELREIKSILSRGQFLDGRKFKRTQGEAGRCHENSVLGWEANKDKAIIMCGYALSDDGCWYFHSWLINVMNNSQPLETTPIKRYAYFGYALNLEESEELLSWY